MIAAEYYALEAEKTKMAMESLERHKAELRRIRSLIEGDNEIFRLQREDPELLEIIKRARDERA